MIKPGDLVRPFMGSEIDVLPVPFDARNERNPRLFTIDHTMVSLVIAVKRRTLDGWNDGQALVLTRGGRYGWTFCTGLYELSK